MVFLDTILEEVRGFLQEHVSTAYLVGGYLRDFLLGRETRDIDILLPQEVMALARMLAARLGGFFVPLDEERGTARIVLLKEEGRYRIDISRMQGGSLEADLARRDFTINALAQELLNPEAKIVDLYGGERDLRERRLRAISESTFRDDPLRLLRGVRLAGELGLQVESHTEELMRRDAPLIASSSSERVRDELIKILSLPDSAASLRYLHQLGLLLHIIPEVGDESLPHPLDTVEALERLLTLEGEEVWCSLLPTLQRHLGEVTADDGTRFTTLKLVALLHHAGQPKVEHPPPEGASSIRAILKRLRFANRELRRAEKIALGNPLAWRLGLDPPPDVEVYRFFRALKEGSVEALLLSLADHLACRRGNMHSPKWRNHLSNVVPILSRYFSQERGRIFPPRLVTGTDLRREFHLAPGPLIGHLLEKIREAQVEGKVTTREEALKLVGGLLKEGR